MNKLFYTDALKAGYMAQEFQVMFVSPLGTSLIHNSGDSFSCADCLHGEYSGEYYYVHPDSIHIYEPKAGDLCIIHGIGGDRFDVWKSKYNVNHCIIFRNGKPFFMPQVDEVIQDSSQKPKDAE